MRFHVSVDGWGQAWLPAVPVSDRELPFTHIDSQSRLWPTVDTAWAMLDGDSDRHMKAEWGQGTEKAGSQEGRGDLWVDNWKGHSRASKEREQGQHISVILITDQTLCKKKILPGH